MFTLILGKDDGAIVDEGLVAIMDFYNRRPAPSFIYAEALAMGIRHKLAWPILKQTKCSGILATRFIC
jgi:hypothetical protein